MVAVMVSIRMRKMFVELRKMFLSARRAELRLPSRSCSKDTRDGVRRQVAPRSGALTFASSYNVRVPGCRHSPSSRGVQVRTLHICHESFALLSVPRQWSWDGSTVPHGRARR